MKTTDPLDPLDRKIDALLSEQPLRASGDFAARTLAAAEAAQKSARRHRSARLLRFALPAAAAVALALFLNTGSREDTAPQDQLAQTPQRQQQKVDPAEAPLDTGEWEELFRLQEGLSGLATIEQEALNSEDLPLTLDTLVYGFES